MQSSDPWKISVTASHSKSAPIVTMYYIWNPYIYIAFRVKYLIMLSRSVFIYSRYPTTQDCLGLREHSWSVRNMVHISRCYWYAKKLLRLKCQQLLKTAQHFMTKYRVRAPQASLLLWTEHWFISSLQDWLSVGVGLVTACRSSQSYFFLVNHCSSSQQSLLIVSHPSRIFLINL